MKRFPHATSRLAGSAIVAAAAAATAVLGAGVADAQGAPDVQGKKYSEASTVLADAGYTAQVSTTVGDQLSRDDCLVTNQRTGMSPSAIEFRSGPFAPSNGSTVLVSLNCNGGAASIGGAGNSAASPEGKKAAQEQADIEYRGTAAGQQDCRAYERQNPDAASLPGC
jgi:hypothetical protein